MKLIHNQLGLQFEFKENLINELVVENPKILSELIQEMQEQYAGEEGNWVLSELDVPLVNITMRQSRQSGVA